MLYVGRGKECDAHRRQSTEKKRIETYSFYSHFLQKVTFTTVNIGMLGKCNNFSFVSNINKKTCELLFNT